MEKGEVTITPELLRKELDEKIKDKKAAVQVIGIADYIESVMIPSMRNRSDATVKAYEDLAKRLKNFEDKKR